MAKILIVDDRSFIRQFLLTLLGYGGHELMEAVNGAVALEKTKAERPDLVITDILMPVMDGFEFTRRLRQDPDIAATPVIFYTATYREPEARALAESCGVRTVLPKPCEPQIILAAVDRELGLTSPIPEDLVSIVPSTTDIHELKRLDGKLAWYADELRSVKSSMDSLFGLNPVMGEEQGKLADLSTKFAESLKGMQRLSSRLTSIIEITLDASPERGPAYIIEAFFDAAIKIIGSRYAAVGIVDKTSRKLEHVFAKGVDAKLFLGEADAGSGLLKSFVTQHSIRRLQNSGDPIQGMPQKHPAVGAFLGCSVASRDWVHGWIYFANDPSDGDFTDEDERIAGTIGAEIAIFYENAALYDLLQRHAAQLQVEVMRREKAESETRARDRLLAQAQKAEAIGQLTGGIAHDFNNLLTVIRANAEDLGEDLSQSPGLQRQASLILQAADRGADLVRQLLAYARKQELHPHVFNVNALFSPFVTLLRRTLQENISIEIAAGEGLPPVNADKGSLENVLLNLALNARDAMPNGGSITFSTAKVTLDAASAAGRADAKPGDYVMISVTDTGSGMAQDVIERAFEPFFTTKEVGKGSGLGLSMVYGFVTQSGGHAQIISQIGQGTAIRLYLPAVIETVVRVSSASLVPAAAEVSPASVGSILLVEDDDLVRDSVTNKLRRLGYTVTAAPSADIAISTLEKNAAFDLIFTDVIMPGDMTGADLARVVQTRWPRIKILATSGYTETTMLGKIRLPVGIRLLSKPYSNKELAQTLTEVMAASPV